MSKTDTPRGPIPALWVVVGVPLATVLASLITVWLSVSGAESELPAYYHSEGLELDADLARARRAAELGVRAELAVTADGAAMVGLSFDSPQAEAPAEITLRLTHATLAERDRIWTLERGSDGRYRGRAAAPGNGPWLVQIDVVDDWLLRGRLPDTTTRLRLGAGTP
jgi:hypothetical protein